MSKRFSNSEFERLIKILKKNDQNLFNDFMSIDGMKEKIKAKNFDEALIQRGKEDGVEYEYIEKFYNMEGNNLYHPDIDGLIKELNKGNQKSFEDFIWSNNLSDEIEDPEFLFQLYKKGKQDGINYIDKLDDMSIELWKHTIHMDDSGDHWMGIASQSKLEDSDVYKKYKESLHDRRKTALLSMNRAMPEGTKPLHKYIAEQIKGGRKRKSSRTVRRRRRKTRTRRRKVSKRRNSRRKTRRKTKKSRKKRSVRRKSRRKTRKSRKRSTKKSRKKRRTRRKSRKSKRRSKRR